MSFQVTTIIIPLLLQLMNLPENYCFEIKLPFFSENLDELVFWVFHVSFEMLENIVRFSPRKEKKHSGKRERRERRKKSDLY